jgi:hypothetical protein
MSNGDVGKVGTSRAIVLAALIVLSCACDLGAASPPASKAASNAPERQPPQVRYQVDPARNRVWLLTRDGVFLYDIKTPEKIAITLPGWQWVDMPYSSLPDLALGPRGEAVITSNIVPTLWRIDPETLAVGVHPLELDADAGKDVGFSGLAYSSRHAAFFAVSWIHGSLWRIDPQFRKAEKILLSAPIAHAYGLAVSPRIAGSKANRPAGLCVSAPQGDRAISLAADRHFASVRAVPCADT